MNWNSPDLRGRRQLGLTLFLLSLAMLFGASIAAFAYLRLTSPALQGNERLELPLVLVVATAVLLGAGLAMYQATQNAKRGHFPLLRRWLSWTWGLSALFIAVQVPGLIQLLDRHRVLEESTYGIAFALVVGACAACGRRHGAVVDAGLEGARESARQRALALSAGLRCVLAFSRSGVACAAGCVFFVGVRNARASFVPVLLFRGIDEDQRLSLAVARPEALAA